jgi:hypothetical protein
MTPLRFSIPFSVLLLAPAPGCTQDTSPLDGAWTQSVDLPGVAEGKETLSLDSGGTLTMTREFSRWMGNPCTGSFRFAGGTWSATATTITLGSTPACTGSAECTSSGPLACGDIEPVGASPGFTAGYTLEDGADTLVIEDGTTTLTFTRAD